MVCLVGVRGIVFVVVICVDPMMRLRWVFPFIVYLIKNG